MEGLWGEGGGEPGPAEVQSRGRLASPVSRCASHGVDGNGGQPGRWKSVLFSQMLISPAIAFWAIGEQWGRRRPRDGEGSTPPQPPLPEPLRFLPPLSIQIVAD